MFVSRRLDDQSFDEILAEAEGRLPWLCPVWTDYNAHDPGITILELMAWYKEIQQYQMDQLTPALRRKLLELAGVRPLPGEGARCALEFPDGAPARRRLERLTTPQGVPFELLEPVPGARSRLERVVILQNGGDLDVTAMAREGMVFQPFRFGGQGASALRLGLRPGDSPVLRLWFQVEEPGPVARNPADGHTPPPRRLSWELEGAGPVTPSADGTWSLSWSGYVTLPVSEQWERGEAGLHWLTVRLEEAGCEEQPRLSGVSAGRFQAAQQESRVERSFFTIDAAPEQQVLLDSAQAQGAELAFFLREEAGWKQTDAYRWERTPQGRLLTVDGTGAAEDGKDNLLVVCLDKDWAGQMLLTTRGQPGEELYLHMGEQTVLPGGLELMCMTLCRDGAVRPALWKRVEDLAVSGPRDRVLVFDSLRETVQFGDGRHGAIPAAGVHSVLVTRLVLSLCGGGNIPAGAGLRFADGTEVSNHPAAGGRDPETLAQAQGRLIKRLAGTDKCLSAEDYARRVKETPGLRVAGAKALPGYDPRTPSVRRHAMVTVAVLPAGEEPYPTADGRFLTAVNRQLERCRTVCICTRAVPVRYVPFFLTLEVKLEPGTGEETVRRALEDYFRPREELIGAAVRQSQVAAMLQKLPGLVRLLRLELHGLDQNSYRTAAGDLELPPDALPRLELEQLQLAVV